MFPAPVRIEISRKISNGRTGNGQEASGVDMDGAFKRTAALEGLSEDNQRAAMDTDQRVRPGRAECDGECFCYTGR